MVSARTYSNSPLGIVPRPYRSQSEKLMSRVNGRGIFVSFSLLFVSPRWLPISNILYLYSRLGGGEADVAEIKSHPFFASINWDDLLAKKVNLYLRCWVIY